MPVLRDYFADLGPGERICHKLDKLLLRRMLELHAVAFAVAVTIGDHLRKARYAYAVPPGVNSTARTAKL